MLHTKYRGSRLCGFKQQDFVMFLYISLCKNMSVFGPRGITCTNLVEVQQKVLHIKALGLMVSDKKIFRGFVLKIIFSLCDLYMQRMGTI